MSRQQRLIYLPLIGTALLCLLIGAYVAAWKRRSKSDPPAKVVKHSLETPSEDTVKYWTADKMRNARPAKLPNVNALSRRKQQPPNTSNTPDA